MTILGKKQMSEEDIKLRQHRTTTIKQIGDAKRWQI